MKRKSPGIPPREVAPSSSEARAEPAWVAEGPEGALLRLHVRPRAAHSEVVGVHGEGSAARLKIRVAAPPVDGAANAEVLRLLAVELRVPRANLELSRGAASSSKDVLVRGIPAALVAARLGF